MPKTRTSSGIVSVGANVLTGGHGRRNLIRPGGDRTRYQIRTGPRDALGWRMVHWLGVAARPPAHHHSSGQYSRSRIPRDW